MDHDGALLDEVSGRELAEYESGLAVFEGDDVVGVGVEAGGGSGTGVKDDLLGEVEEKRRGARKRSVPLLQTRYRKRKTLVGGERAG